MPWVIRLKSLVLTSMLFSILVAACFTVSASRRMVAPVVRGLRTEDLELYFYSDSTSTYSALKNGDTDFMMERLTCSQYQDAIIDRKIIVAPFVENKRYEFDLNHNYTIKTYPGIRNPLTSLKSRQALARLTDKTYIVDEICGGYAVRLDTPIPPFQKGWWNESVTGKTIHTHTTQRKLKDC